jgi:hypothetical protein
MNLSRHQASPEFEWRFRPRWMEIPPSEEDFTFDLSALST